MAEQEFNNLNEKLERLLALMEAQLELAKLKQQNNRLHRAHLSGEETIEFSPSEGQAGGNESIIGDPQTPTPVSQPRRSVSFVEVGEQDDVNYEKYASPTGPKYLKPRMELYNRTRTEPYVLDSEEDTSMTANLPQSKPIATPFPKFNPQDVEIFILEAEAWFKFNQVYEQTRMINHMGSQLEGNTCEWWVSKICIDRACEGRLFHDWYYFTERLLEQFNPKNAQMEAYNKLLALKLTSDAPGTATRHVERFCDLEGQVNLEDNELIIDLFRGSLTRSLQEKFECNPPARRWEWYREVEDIDRQRMLLQQSSSRHPSAGLPRPNPGIQPTPLAQSSFPVWQPSNPARPLAQTMAGNPNRPTNWLSSQPFVPGLKQGNPMVPGNNTCHICKGIGHWARDCPSKKPDPLGPRPSGPRVMVAMEDPFEEGATDSGDGHTGSAETSDPDELDLSQYQAPNDTDWEEPLDDAEEGNFQIHLSVAIGKHRLGVVEVLVADTTDYNLFLGFTELRRLKPTIQWDTGQLDFQSQDHNQIPEQPPEAATTKGLHLKSSKSVIVARLSQDLMKIATTSGKQHGLVTRDSLSPISTKSVATASYDEKTTHPTMHGNKFVSAKRLLQAALEDGPIGFMLLEVPPDSLPAFSFVPTSTNRGVEMEVEIEKEVMAKEIPQLYQHLRDVFDEVEADKLPQHTEHDLHLELVEGSRLPQGPLYLKGPKEMSELRKYLDENFVKGFIQPSKSPARSPVLFVRKKDGGLRLCVDYQGLNKITVKNQAPLPLIEEQLFLLRKAKIYSKLDLRAAYNLIRIVKGDEWKTVFGTQLGLYEYLVMPFRLANAPAHFQSYINDIFQDIIGVYVVVYLDDFLIFSDTEEVHILHVTEVLRRLRLYRLFAKLSKCEFHTTTVEFLGYIIKPTRVEMDPKKVQTIKEWPVLESIHDIQRFLGFANFYRRFIAHFARIAKPLTSLVKLTEHFKKLKLPEEAQQAFHKLIQAFTTAGVLQHFDYHLPTRLETDASDFAIAGVLKQEHESCWHPVAFYSRKMSSAERNYEIHDKELLAVVACLTQWQHMLAGLPSQLVILTDHEALKYFKSQCCITGRQARWAVLLADFNFVLQYRPGDRGGEPDTLTRRADMQPASEEQEHNVWQLLPS
ncbi:hypothetical protein NDA13_006492 [Ustilago tritici]|nr:hypothetical protein NDA13_006486 [Ustilago tritici]KAJ1018178.1 hypothetical protein NDA13_006488 [Ustilago tritici]KAJ1018180.1 hypothetical protein NDA13_006490 [Ustilago tritici]KAJ1018182.1 hypothetical protein NDA13_006492 [Ustilago tritici]